ncbi:MAG: Na+/H+ antiporter NhaC [Planctomycetota bacterium]|jgi:Na+/H+ antiporter NhaC
MTRILATLAALLALVGVFFMPNPDTAELAALQGTQVLSRMVADPEGAEGAEVPLWELVLRSPNYEESEDGKALITLAYARLEMDGLDLLSPAHAHFEDALIRGLRQKVREVRGRALYTQATRNPSEEGMRFHLGIGEDRLGLIFGSTPSQSQTIEFTWRPAGSLSLLPPLVAILLAVLLRRPVVSLFMGVFTGAFLLRQAVDPNIFFSVGLGLKDVFTEFFLDEALDKNDAGRLQVAGFVIGMLAMVGIITKNGGIRGLMNILAKWAKNARSTQIATYFMGLAVFFDDYANTILVGSTMRPLTDRYRIAREKLAYIVDSTAAPVAGLSIFSTWIAFEVSTFSAQLPAAGMSPDDGYSVFIATLPYRFYCILTLVLVFLVTFTGLDFGPMLGAERRARKTGKLVRDGGNPMVSDIVTAMSPAEGITFRAWRALVPLAVFILVTCYTILDTGGAFAADAPSLFSISGLSQVLGDGDSYGALLNGSSLGLLVAVIASLSAGLRLEILDAAWKTLSSMAIALGILYLAWMIGAVCGKLGTAEYLTVLLGDIQFPLFLPVVLFLLSGCIAFATGSSWSTMSILLPLVIGLSFSLGERIEIGGYGLMILSIGAVLEGSIFGDHCSPISDTTVLSSVASACDHIDHVRTQMPYAVFTMVCAISIGYLPAAAFGLHPAWSIAGGSLLLYFGLRVLGKRADDDLDATSVPSE